MIDGESDEQRRIGEMWQAAFVDADGAVARERVCAALAEHAMTVAFYDPEVHGWTFGADAPGPAGTVSVSCGGGAVLTVDAADPGRFVSLSVSAQDRETAPALVRATVGAQAAGLLAQKVQDALVTVVRCDALSSALGRNLSRLAVLDDARARDEDERGVWPLWAGEAAELCAGAGALPALDARARIEAQTCVDVLCDVARSRLTADARERLAAVATAVTALLPDGSDRSRLVEAIGRSPTAIGRPSNWSALLLERAERYLSLPRQRMPDFELRPTAQLMMSGDPGRGRREPGATFYLDEALVHHGLTRKHEAQIFLDAAGKLEVRCWSEDESEPDLEEIRVRVFTATDLILLDAGRLSVKSAHGKKLVVAAHLRVPPGTTYEQIRVDVTAEPDQPAPGSRLDLIRDATRDGRAASDAGRAHEWELARGLWHRCSQSWQDAGNQVNWLLAVGYKAEANDHLSGSGDEERQSAARSFPEASWRLVRRRVPAKPFLAEMIEPPHL